MSEADERITVVGIGDDGPSGLGNIARRTIETAEVLYGGARHLAWFPQHSARRVDLGTDFAAALRELDAPSVQRRVVLASGDPMHFGMGATLAARVGAGRIAVIPHVSSTALAFARIGESMRDAVTLSAHGRDLRPVLARAMTSTRTAILLDNQHDARMVARALLDAGMEDANTAVCSHLGGPNEAITRGRLSAIVAAPAFPSLSLLVLLRDAAEVEKCHRTAIADTEFAHRDGMITKAEVRALSVAALHLRPLDLLWDVGAGSGSVATEAALQLSGGAVYAIEQDAVQQGFIRENAVRFRVPQVHCVAGEAPAVLDALPPPNAVFVGGGGDNLAAIVEACVERLLPGGRLVINLVALERLGPLLEQLRRWSPSTTQVSVARGVAAGGATRLDALNPVYIVAATKPGSDPATETLAGSVQQ